MPEHPIRRFAARIIDWYQGHGRKALPWQQPCTPYRVWISEIMLQQTQVKTVIPYFHTFMRQFPDVFRLADASLDQVLHCWTGLGYYARAINCHRSACIIAKQYDGQFPNSLQAAMALPGIGRSTAGAILSLAYHLPHAILDGNVKRVLARVHAIEGWPGLTAVNQQLWALADDYTPKQKTAQYNQAMMDLGSLVCTRSKPRCDACPVAGDCAAYQSGRVQDYPGKKPYKKRKQRHCHFLLLCERRSRSFLLQKRPQSGIWSGLWSFVECPEQSKLSKWCLEKLACRVDDMQTWPAQAHDFTHFRLHFTPILAYIESIPEQLLKNGQYLWYNCNVAPSIGLAAPVKRLLEQLQTGVCL